MTASTHSDDTQASAKLEDLMVAMDVVDTLRHRQQMVDRELDADGRRARLIDKLRDIYASQGLAVTDAMLEEGVKALEEERFQYDPPQKTFAHTLARLYISRTKWLKPLLLLTALFSFVFALCWFILIQPERNAIQQLPHQITHLVDDIKSSTDDAVALQRADDLSAQALQAIDSGDHRQTKRKLEQLRQLQAHINQSYTIRVVQRPGESSGVWRIPDVNQQARNYYLIVEALDSSGRTLTLPITSEETGQVRQVNKWGVRVDSNLFYRIADDKNDDGIIQNRNLGQKASGEYQPRYSVPILDGMITEW